MASRQADLEVRKLQNLVLQRNVCTSFWEILVSCREAKGAHTDDLCPLRASLESLDVQ